ncbi:phosphoglycerate mutase-like protein [Phanerochaete sordida]|uniref:Phosphoglycerate mutase-like protein n=1 Tax=Phanerochaete sordida TaxID=48140 RepID=A0A9P3GBT1_9APHY|nr:phosphoglycerate mutase-like protein [Phanerochaete sordida]
MGTYSDIKYGDGDDELLPQPAALRAKPPPWNRKLHVLAGFVVGILTCLSVLHFYHSSSTCNIVQVLSPTGSVELYASPWAGSSEVHHFPPPSPTNANPKLFPTDVGFAGHTATGAEPALVVTAPSYPIHTGAPGLVAPSFDDDDDGDDDDDDDFDLFRHWGNLSPWYTIERGTFGVDAKPDEPDTCSITGVHLLHRHGARYPTSFANYGGPANIAGRLHENAAEWTAEGELKFLNTWTYKLGEELLTPFGRQQMYDLGVSTRLKYGFLLRNFSEKNTIPVFRTESQDRMLASAINFALGFFGHSLEGQYQQSITIEEIGFNNTLASYMTCPNFFFPDKGGRATWYVERWADIYLADALDRLALQLHGYDLTTEDLYAMQEMCAYETVAIGYSAFCGLFTEEEWRGFNYALDLFFWYTAAWGSPLARVLGIGYVQELVARLTHEPIATHNSSTNATLADNPTTFPLHDALYVDATHEVIVLNVLTALNLTNFAATGPLPYDHIPRDRAFKSAQLAPFGTNVHFQLLSCGDRTGTQIRVIVNDGVVPLTSVRGCPEDEDGLCPVETFVDAMRELIQTTDWQWGCWGDWSVPGGDGWNTTDGYPPAPV